jgi:hypothetical protein
MIITSWMGSWSPSWRHRTSFEIVRNEYALWLTCSKRVSFRVIDGLRLLATGDLGRLLACCTVSGTLERVPIIVCFAYDRCILFPSNPRSTAHALVATRSNRSRVFRGRIVFGHTDKRERSLLARIAMVPRDDLSRAPIGSRRI